MKLCDYAWQPSCSRNLLFKKMIVLLFWVRIPCRFICRYQSFGETYRPYLQGCFYKTLVSAYEFTWCNNPEEWHCHFLHHKILKSYIWKVLQNDRSVSYVTCNLCCFRQKNLKGIDHLGYMGIDEKIILKWSLKKYSLRVWT